MPNKDPSFTPLEMRNIPLLKDIVCGRFHALLLSGIVLRDVRFESKETELPIFICVTICLESNEVFGFGGGGNAQLARRMSVEETYLRRVGDRVSNLPLLSVMRLMQVISCVVFKPLRRGGFTVWQSLVCQAYSP